ncbi:hypothetical protein BOVMAS25_11020 [Streptococcus uberis]
MFEDVTLKLSKKKEKELLANYSTQLQVAFEKAIADQEHWKPYVRMSDLCQYLGVSTTTLIKWQKEGMPHIVIDGVTLYDKRKISKWLSHVETCVLLSHKSADDFISVKMEYADDRKIQPDRITYRLIQEYIEEKYGFKVHTANIAEVKRNLGLPMYDAPNAVEELKRPYKPAPEYKVEAIKDALRHFKVID